MIDWLKMAKIKFSEVPQEGTAVTDERATILAQAPHQGTANTDERSRTAVTTVPDQRTSTKKEPGISVADVLRVFPGARVLNEAEANALGVTSPHQRPPQQLRLIPGGKS